MGVWWGVGGKKGKWQPEGGKLHHKCCANRSASPLPSDGGLVSCPFSALSLLEDGVGGDKKKKKARWLHVRASTGPRVWPSRVWKLKVTQVVLIARL